MRRIATLAYFVPSLVGLFFASVAAPALAQQQPQRAAVAGQQQQQPARQTNPANSANPGARPPVSGPTLPVRNLSAPRPNAPQPSAAAGQQAGAPSRVAPAGGPQTAGNPRGAVRAAQAQAPIAGPPGNVNTLPAQPATQAPFRLTPAQQQALDQVLVDWETHSQAVKSFTCTLTRWEVDKVFNKTTVGVGDLKYRAPDNGLYRVKEKETDEMLEHWVCDGESIYEYNYTKKELIQRVLPANMRGKAIADGPLPFIFGAEANKLKQRYWMRLLQPPQGHEDKICIEAFPRMQLDAANFRRAELLLTKQGMLPFALQIDMNNGKSHTVHRFDQIVTNDPLRGLKDIFTAPRAYPGWKKIVDDPQTAEALQPSENPTEQARAPQAAPR